MRKSFNDWYISSMATIVVSYPRYDDIWIACSWEDGNIIDIDDHVLVLLLLLSLSLFDDDDA